MVSDLSKDRTGQFLFAGGGRVAELKMIMADGIRSEDPAKITAQEIARGEDVVFCDQAGASALG